jgi:SAM-dependent methyltransferase
VPHVRPRDLSIQITDDGAFVVRAPGRAVAARVPGLAVEILAFCSAPRSRDDVVARYGPPGGKLFDGLAGVGLLLPPEEAARTPVMFSNFASVDVHRRMLADTPRMEQYAAAIAAVVKPGMVVLDAGSGSGVLGGLAAAAGAAKVYLVDNSDMIDVSRETMRASGFAERSACIRADLAEVDLPEKADVIVTETFGSMALAEGGLDDLVACAARNLAPGGVMIPSGLSLHVAPVADRALLDEALGPFRPWKGVALDTLRGSTLHRGMTAAVRPDQLAAAGVAFSRMDLPATGRAAGRVSFDVDGEIQGLLGWFTLHLAPGVDLPTGPADPLTHWKHTFLPLEPFRVSGRWELEIDVGPAADDRRGTEVHCAWDGGSSFHRVR